MAATDGRVEFGRYQIAIWVGNGSRQTISALFYQVSLSDDFQPISLLYFYRVLEQTWSNFASFFLVADE